MRKGTAGGSQTLPYKYLLIGLLVAAACSPRPVIITPLPTPTHTVTPTRTPLSGTVMPTLLTSVPPGNEPPTPTERPTSDPPDVPPGLIAPKDGAILNGTFPDFEIVAPPRSSTVHIVIYNIDGYWQEYIYGVDAGLPGWMNDLFTPVAPSPLPPGTYQWYAFGCPQTAVGGCGPGSGTWIFTIVG